MDSLLFWLISFTTSSDSVFSSIAAAEANPFTYELSSSRLLFSAANSSFTSGKSAVSVDDTLKIIGCREQQKKLSALEMELAAARQEGFVTTHLSKNKTPPKKRPLVVIGVLTGFGRKNNREVIRKAWMATGDALKKMEDEKGVIARFVIGRSANRGDSLDRDIDIENKNYNDFFILESHVETPEELPKKTKLFFAHAAERWEAEYYAKVNDDVYVNIEDGGTFLSEISPEDVLAYQIVVQKGNSRGVHFRRRTQGKGIKTVIREIVCGLNTMYGVNKILGSWD